MRKTVERAGIGASLLIGVMATAAFVSLPESPVADAAQRGDLEEVRALLKTGADVNAAQGDGMTALHWAALRGDVDMARVLVYAGANLESTTRLGAYTALHLASRNGRADMVAALLAAGADPRAPTSTGVTPLHLAADAGSADAIEILLGAGALVDAKESANGQTPLMFAAAAGRLAAVETLIAAGADLSVPTVVLDYAARAESDGQARRRRMEVVAAIRKAEAQARGEYAEADTRVATRTETPPGQQTPRREAEAAADAHGKPTTKEGVPDPAAELKAERPDPRVDPPQGEDPPPEAPRPAVAHDPPAAAAHTPQAAAHDPPQGEDPPEKPEDVELGADPRRPAGEAPPEAAADTASNRAAAPEPMSYAQLVGRQGGMTALQYAVRDGYLPVVQALLASGADIDGPTEGDRSTPLVIATINGHYDLALWLLEAGADPTLASVDGVTPLYATIANRWAPKALYPQPTAFKQQEASYLDLMEALLKKGADPDVRLEKHIWYSSFNFDLLGVDFQGATPFWRAAYALDVPAMRLLVAHGADPDTPTRKPPERRRRGNDDEEGGASSDEDPSGLPPVEPGGPGVPPIVAAAGVGYGRARAGNSHRHAPDSWLAAARFLIEEVGADPNARDHDGFSPLHYAAARGDNELIEYLVSKGADPTVVARTGQTTVDMANGPIQRVQPFPETIALLEGMGAKNNDKCVSC